MPKISFVRLSTVPFATLFYRFTKFCLLCAND